MSTLATGSLFLECDFCGKKGVAGKPLVQMDHEYFCPLCLGEIEKQQKDH